MRCVIVLFALAAGLAADRPFVIRIVDSQTGRGVPLVELRTVNQRAWYSDSNGTVAVSDSWAMGRDVFFQVRSHGYRFEERVLDEIGIILPVRPGGHAELRIVRENIAERLYRITGAGIYADSVAAGVPVPIRRPLLNGKVTGQDTAIAIPYRGRIYWFWGDTVGPANMNFNASGEPRCRRARAGSIRTAASIWSTSSTTTDSAVPCCRSTGRGWYGWKAL
jgi:hypothetical protein